MGGSRSIWNPWEPLYQTWTSGASIINLRASALPQTLQTIGIQKDCTYGTETPKRQRRIHDNRFYTVRKYVERVYWTRICPTCAHNSLFQAVTGIIIMGHESILIIRSWNCKYYVGSKKCWQVWTCNRKPMLKVIVANICRTISV